MIALIQRVSSASVRVDGCIIGEISTGLLALVAIEVSDHGATVERMTQRLLRYRVFPDSNGKMNLGLKDSDGGLLLVPQFTLAADTGRGLRPSFSGKVADPVLGQQVFLQLVDSLRQQHSFVETGQFGADMQVALVNEGPVTFWLQV